MTGPVLAVDDATKVFRRRGAPDVVAVSEVSFTVARAESLGIVGESGAGKSTISRIALGLLRPDRGVVRVLGEDLWSLPRRELTALRRHVQMVFQDPYSSFDPTIPIGRSVRQPLDIQRDAGSRASRDEQVASLLRSVGLGPELASRYPSELSGGQLQRASIARAVALGPALVVCDEPVASLDVSIRGQILNLLRDLQDSNGTSYLFISHDLALVRRFADRIVVMFGGRAVESAPAEELFRSPSHPYTRALLDAAPPALRDATTRTGRARAAALAPIAPGPGCPYRLRCELRTSVCDDHAPDPTAISVEHRVACHHAGGVAAGIPDAEAGAPRPDTDLLGIER